MDSMLESLPNSDTEETPANIEDLIQALRESVEDSSQSETNPLKEYITNEYKMLVQKQNSLQQELQVKAKEIQSIRETILVVSGAMQALQHVGTHMGIKIE